MSQIRVAKFSVTLLFIYVVAALLAMTIPVSAHAAAKVYRIGFLANVASNRAIELKPFLSRLGDLGYAESRDFMVEERYWEGNVDRLPALADELVGLKCDVITTSGTESAITARNATKSIPIVVAFGPDVLRLGLVKELAHPGGNITGMTSIGTELYGKKLELLKDALPKLSKVAFIWSSTNPSGDQTKDVGTLARALRLDIQSYEVKEPDKIDGVFQSAKNYGAHAVLLGAGGFFGFHQKRIIDLAAKYRLPVMYSNVRYAETGGLMAYAYDRLYQFRRAAEYVDKIFKGAKPADLPVERPSKFELVINLKAAKQIGLTIPPNVLARADKVIR
jgi:putative ABC transport system substrate-binding protein